MKFAQLVGAGISFVGRIPAGAILAAGLLIRLLFVYLLWNQPFMGDSRLYHQEALSWVEGKGPGGFWPPGLPAYLAAISLVLGKTELVARFSMLVWYGLGAWVVSRLGRKVAGGFGRNWALLLFSFYPSLIMASVEPLSQLPTGVLLAAAWCLLFPEIIPPKPNRSFLAAGVCLGFSVLVRSSTFPLIFFPALVGLLYSSPFRKTGWKVSLIAMLIPLGYSTALSLAKGHTIWINEANSRNFYLGNTPWTPTYKTWYLASHWGGESWIDPAFLVEHDSLSALPPHRANAAYSTLAWGRIAADPGGFALRTVSRGRTLWVFDTLAATTAQSIWGWPLISVGSIALVDAFCWILVSILSLMALLPNRKRKPLSWVPIFFVMLFSVPFLLSFSHPTYHQPLLLLILPFSSSVLKKGNPIQFSPTLLIVLFVFGALQLEWIWALAHPGPW